MNYIKIILIIIAIIGILSIIYITIYNNLINYKLTIEKSEGIIDEALRSKYDLIVKLIPQ